MPCFLNLVSLKFTKLQVLNRKVFVMRFFLFAVTWLALTGTGQAAGLAFAPTADEAYEFDTGLLQGSLRAGGKSLGLSALVHKPSGTRLDGAGYGIFSHYRVFTTNRRYGPAAWDWPSQSKRLPDGAVQVYWPVGDDHPLELYATYRWRSPNTLDLETRVKAYTDLPQFESFLASYFASDFPASSVYAKAGPGTDRQPSFLSTDKQFGLWQMFPRDGNAVQLIQDGRWERPPHPVAWTMRPNLALPIGLRRHAQTGLTVVLMAPAQDCFALSTPYAGEGHYSLYLSLFGRSVPAGQTATARARLVIADAPTDAQILSLYKAYMEDLSQTQADTPTGFTTDK